jgi:Mrp family chromosome partitioning ATPase
VTVGFSHSNIKHISRLVNNRKLKTLLEQLRKQVDYIVMDTPPMLVASDAEALALLSDTAVMVVRTDFLQATAINDCLDKLRKATPDLCGVVLNNHRTNIF